METTSQTVNPKDQALFALIDQVLAEYERTQQGEAPK